MNSYLLLFLISICNTELDNTWWILSDAKTNNLSAQKEFSSSILYFCEDGTLKNYQGVSFYNNDTVYVDKSTCQNGFWEINGDTLIMKFHDDIILIDPSNPTDSLFESSYRYTCYLFKNNKFELIDDDKHDYYEVIYIPLVSAVKIKSK
jgi:hypothetical protein